MRNQTKRTLARRAESENLEETWRDELALLRKGIFYVAEHR